MRSCAPPWGLPRWAMACTSVPRVHSSRLAIAGWIGRRTRCIREREAHSASFPALYAEARVPKGSGPFSFPVSTGLRIGTGQRSMDRTTARGGRSLTSCRKAASVLADGMPCTFCGCSSVGRARPRHGRGHEFETRHPLHFGCVHALRGHACMVLVARDVRDPRPESRAARHHIRRGARVWAQPKWVRPDMKTCLRTSSCLPNRPSSARAWRGIAMSRSSSWPRTLGFHSGNAGSLSAKRWTCRRRGP